MRGEPFSKATGAGEEIYNLNGIAATHETTLFKEGTKWTSLIELRAPA
jgi:hypothetical protein